MRDPRPYLLSSILAAAAATSGTPHAVHADTPTVSHFESAVEPNPYLSIPLPGARPNYERWQAQGKDEVAELLTTRVESFEEPLEIVEREQVAGANDRPETAEPLSGFSARNGTSAVHIAGRLGFEPLRAPRREDNGDLRKATDLAIRPGELARMAGAIGDGPHARAGSGSGDFDFFVARNVPAGQPLRVFAKAGRPARASEGPIDPSLVLYDARGNVLAWDSLWLTVDQIEYVVPETGDYYISVTSFPGQYLNDPFDSSTGFGADVEGEYELAVSVGAPPVDTDHYSFDLEPGDILGARVDGGSGTTIAIALPDGQTAVESGVELSFVYPDRSPLPIGGVASAAHVASVAGRYSVAVSHAPGSAAGAYDAELRVFRPVYDATAAHQTIFVDFDGATLDAAIFGGYGVATLSPLAAFLGDFGLAPADQNALIDAVLARMQQSLERDIAALGLSSGFEIEIRNSRDHAEAFGQPGVSRVVVGGSVEQIGIATVGIAETIDVGNFADSESALVLLDTLSREATRLPIAPGRTRLELAAVGIANLVAHELGHILGNFHTSHTSTRRNLMDEGTQLEPFFEVGPDGVFGTRDDIEMRFGSDELSKPEGMRGAEDTLNRIAFALETQPALPVAPARLDALLPRVVLAGDFGARIEIVGDGFTPLSRVRVGARTLLPRFDHRRLLSLSLDPELLRTPGSVQLQVVTPASGAASASRELEVTLSVRVLGTDFESGDRGGFKVDRPVGRLTWQATSRRSSSGATSFYFGNPRTFTYDTQQREAGTLTSVPLTLPAGAVLSFSSLLATERTFGLDQARVEISSDGFRTSRALLSNQTGELLDGSEHFAGGKFQQVSADLGEFAGQSVQLRFAFDTFDEVENAFEGWYVDDITVLAPAASR